MSYQPLFAITSKMLSLVSDIVEIITDIKHNENVPKNVPKKRLDEIVKLIEKNKEITSVQIAERLKVSDKTIKRDMATLKEQGRIQRVGSLKSGYWEVLNEKYGDLK